MPRSGPASKSYADVRAWVLAVDPELVAAQAEVDLTLLEAASRRSPLERVGDSAALATELERLRELPRR